ncbi:MAG TPA: glycosyltransferase family 4 protein [bacterium]|nr:glycosyltransferase family 4 protein [bacterium]
MPIKVKYVNTHVIQYLAPLIQRLAALEGIELKVIYGTDAGALTYYDRDFGKEIAWDRPLLTGYKYSVLHPGAPLRGGFMGIKGYGLAKLLSPRDTDVVIVHGCYNHLYLMATLTALARNIPLLYRTETHALIKSRPAFKFLKPLFLHPLFRRVDGHLAIGTLNRQYYLDLGVRPERIFWAPYSIDTAFFGHQTLTPADLRAKEQGIGLEPGTFRVIFVGKIIGVKRPADVIEAVALMPSRQAVEVIFVGDGKLRPALEQLAESRAVRAHFLGFRNQSELPGLYALADVIVQPSEHEPWGLVINEAMTAGLAAVVSDVVGCGPDLVIEGRSGSICGVGDTTAMARSLEKMASDPDYLQRLKQGAAEMVKACSMDRTLEGYREAIQAVAARRKPRR